MKKGSPFIKSSIPFSPSRLDTTHFMLAWFRKRIGNGRTIIDIGSGGTFLPWLLSTLDTKLDYLGVDIDPKKSAVKADKIKIKIVKKDILQFNSSRKFDIAACLWTLEHIRNHQSACKKIFGLLNKEGFAVIAVPSIWSWPIEFGRHGYRYYSKSQITKLVQSAGFWIDEFYEAGGLSGLLFMLFYSWPRYLVLLPLSIIYLSLKFFGVAQNSWKEFSHKAVSTLFYSYHGSKKGVLFHNVIVSKIVALDNKLKIFPASYVLILKK